VGDAVREHPGLARPGAGHDEQRAALMDGGLSLRTVEPGEHALEFAAHGTGRRSRECGCAGEGLLDAAHVLLTVSRTGDAPTVRGTCAPPVPARVVTVRRSLWQTRSVLATVS